MPVVTGQASAYTILSGSWADPEMIFTVALVGPAESEIYRIDEIDKLSIYNFSFDSTLPDNCIINNVQLYARWKSSTSYGRLSAQCFVSGSPVGNELVASPAPTSGTVYSCNVDGISTKEQLLDANFSVVVSSAETKTTAAINRFYLVQVIVDYTESTGVTNIDISSQISSTGQSSADLTNIVQRQLNCITSATTNVISTLSNIHLHLLLTSVNATSILNNTLSVSKYICQNVQTLSHINGILNTTVLIASVVLNISVNVAELNNICFLSSDILGHSIIDGTIRASALLASNMVISTNTFVSTFVEHGLISNSELVSDFQTEISIELNLQSHVSVVSVANCELNLVVSIYPEPIMFNIDTKQRLFNFKENMFTQLDCQFINNERYTRQFNIVENEQGVYEYKILNSNIFYDNAFKEGVFEWQLKCTKAKTKF